MRKSWPAEQLGVSEWMTAGHAGGAVVGDAEAGGAAAGSAAAPSVLVRRANTQVNICTYSRMYRCFWPLVPSPVHGGEVGRAFVRQPLPDAQ